MEITRTSNSLKEQEASGEQASLKSQNKPITSPRICANSTCEAAAHSHCQPSSGLHTHVHLHSVKFSSRSGGEQMLLTHTC